MSLYLGTTPIANTGYDKANIDLSNLTSTGKNIANWSNNVTNCITEIPEDIKLELNNGTLTLKAGSKVYVPNGAGVFDVVNISSDITLNKNLTGLYFVFMKSNGVKSDTMPFSYCYSGDSQPTITHTYAIWYDTANNKIKWTNNNGSTWVDGYSLPICIVVNDTPGTQNVSSIEQIFNGFGYIGSTIFALPGVKGLIPNGRNVDGTLKNRSVTTQSVLTATMAITGVVGFRENAIGSSNKYIYDEENNQNLNDGAYWNVLTHGNIQMDNGKITSLTVKTPFHALDYNDSPTISGWAMPSSRYIDLTLGASGSTYTAPANGWAMVTQAFSNSCYIGLVTVYPDKDGICMSSQYNSAAVLNAYISVSKGKTFKVFYGGTKVADSANRFEFIYAEGEN